MAIRAVSYLGTNEIANEGDCPLQIGSARLNFRGYIMHQERDFYKVECYNFLRWRHQPIRRRMRMPSLRCASAWQADAFTEIFTSSVS